MESVQNYKPIENKLFKKDSVNNKKRERELRIKRKGWKMKEVSSRGELAGRC